MGLTRENNEYLKSEGFNPTELSIIRIQKVIKQDFKKKEVEKFEVLFSNGKTLTLNDTNKDRIIWNFGSLENSIGKSVQLYRTLVEIDGKMIPSIKIKYNIFEKLKI